MDSEPSFTHRLAARLASLICPLALAGCGLSPVQPWEKQHLAEPEMLIEPDRLESRYGEHIYFSREGAGGGWGIGGGGCGCN